MLTYYTLNALRLSMHHNLFLILGEVVWWSDKIKRDVRLMEIYSPPTEWHERSLINEFPFRAAIVDTGVLNETLMNHLNREFVYDPQFPKEKVAKLNPRGVWIQSHPNTFIGTLK